MLHIHKLCLWAAALLFAWLALLLNTAEQPARTLVLVVSSWGPAIDGRQAVVQTGRRWPHALPLRRFSLG